MGTVGDLNPDAPAGGDLPVWTVTRQTPDSLLSVTVHPVSSLASSLISITGRVTVRLACVPRAAVPFRAGGGKAQRKERRRPGTRTLGGPCPAKWKEKERPDARPLKPPPRRLLNSHRLRGGNLEVHWLESWRPPTLMHPFSQPPACDMFRTPPYRQDLHTPPTPRGRLPDLGVERPATPGPTGFREAGARRPGVRGPGRAAVRLLHLSGNKPTEKSRPPSSACEAVRAATGSSSRAGGTSLGLRVGDRSPRGGGGPPARPPSWSPRPRGALRAGGRWIVSEGSESRDQNPPGATLNPLAPASRAPTRTRPALPPRQEVEEPAERGQTAEEPVDPGPGEPGILTEPPGIFSGNGNARGLSAPGSALARGPPRSRGRESPPARGTDSRPQPRKPPREQVSPRGLLQMTPQPPLPARGLAGDPDAQAPRRPRGVARWKRAGPGRRPGEAQPREDRGGSTENSREEGSAAAASWACPDRGPRSPSRQAPAPQLTKRETHIATPCVCPSALTPSTQVAPSFGNKVIAAAIGQDVIVLV
ncbi:basic salivary proline-rich protein 2-like [Felis catus]|uniref:basic salivary proline-rich protein 2-like n=1 Tax=Felis catus TaxID=9685 RepID=UPI001D19B7E2|nr:basic salivary proline-rich protein 2-like [Felis catus]